MATTATFGNKTTCTFATPNNTWSGATDVQSVGQFARSVAVADVTPLDQADGKFRTKLFSQRIEHEPINVSYFFNQATSVPVLGQTCDVTLTFPDGDNWTGTGAIIRVEDGGMSDDEVSVGNVEFQFQGEGTAGTAPVFTNP